MKKYSVGFYGGKFLPLHLGHKYCIDVASEQCRWVYVILFHGGSDEMIVRKQLNNCGELSVLRRFRHLQYLCGQYNNVEPLLIDVSKCRNEDGSEDWDAETPLVLSKLGTFDAVYSSEPSYDAYFKRAYPWAEHILVDPPRVVYPISATKIRNMIDNEEKKKWVI